MAKRREVLTSIGTVAIGSIAGCIGDDDPSSPTEVIEARFKALDNGDGERVRELTHWSVEHTIDQELLAEWEAADIEIDNVELGEKSDEEATVIISYVMESNFIRVETKLQKEDGEWKQSDAEVIDS